MLCYNYATNTIKCILQINFIILRMGVFQDTNHNLILKDDIVELLRYQLLPKLQLAILMLFFFFIELSFKTYGVINKCFW